MPHKTDVFPIGENEISETFIRSSGPGGQNVNKVSTAVQLRFNVKSSSFLPPAVKSRLIRLAGKKMSSDGFLIIESGRFSTQLQNRRDARGRLAALIRKAAVEPVKRRATKPGKKAVEARLNTKRRRGEKKKLRSMTKLAE